MSLRENVGLEADPQDDYHVIYEAVFEPTSVDQMQVEIWLEADGYLAVGLERRTRVRERLGLGGSDAGFATGHEPGGLSLQGMFGLLDLVAAGEMVLFTRAGWWGMGRVQAAVSKGERQNLADAGYVNLWWLRALERAPRLWGVRRLEYRAWS